jgi:hypothetical protein
VTVCLDLSLLPAAWRGPECMTSAHICKRDETANSSGFSLPRELEYTSNPTAPRVIVLGTYY